MNPNAARCGATFEHNAHTYPDLSKKFRWCDGRLNITIPNQRKREGD